MGVVIPETARGRMFLISAGALGIIVLAVVAEKWTNGELDAWKHGYHDCKEGVPPSNGEGYESDDECERYYEGFWEALQRLTGNKK